MALTSEQEQRIWTMLNETRGQIGLTAYKDYIFGLLFYKYLSDKIEKMVTSDGQDSYADELCDIMADNDLLDGVYSDLDIAKVIKAASDKSLDIVTVVKDGKF